MVSCSLDIFNSLIMKKKEKSLMIFFVIILLIHFLTFYIFIASQMRLFGDENVYYENSKFIEQLIQHNNCEDFFTCIKKATAPLVGEHFMPGSSLIMALPQVFTDKVSLLRLSILIFNLILIISTSVFVYRFFSPLRSLIYLLLMAALPLNSLGAVFLWNDFISGNILLLSYLLFTYATSQSLTAQFNYRYIFFTGALLGVSFLFRYNTILVALFLGISLSYYFFANHRNFASFLNCSFCLLLGFLIFYTPWMVPSSIKNDQLTLAPKPLRKYEIKTWTISPPMEDMLGYRNGTRYYFKLIDIMQTYNINENTASQLVLDETMQNSTLGSRIRAYRTNFDNFFRNPNQFLGIMMYKTFGGTDSDWAVDVTAKPLIGFHTDGGQYFPKTLGLPFAPNRYLQPASKMQRMYLQWNDTLYGILISFLLASFCVSLASKTCLIPAPHFWPFLLGTCLIPFFHPAHGRYIFALIPTLLYAASQALESLIRLFRTGKQREIRAVVMLTLLFLFSVML